MSGLFLRTCRGEETERRPVWIMRQAGRYLPEYRELRRHHDFISLCKTPELAAEVTLQPVRRLGVDAAIIFADILLPLEAMGAELVFDEPGGPRFPRPVRSREEIARLTEPDVGDRLGYVLEALRRVRRELDPAVALIGFAGTPWTLAAYLVEGRGSKQFAQLLAWSYRDRDGLAELLHRIALVQADYVEAQVDAGADAIQLFDTWGGLLDPRRWQELALPPLSLCLERLRGRVPLIYYINGGFHLLEVLRELPVEVLSVDWRMPLDRVRAVVGSQQVLQGNLDPGALLGPTDTIETAVRDLLSAGGGGGHIANLGHGILPSTPVEHARAFVEAVKRLSAGPAGA